MGTLETIFCQFEALIRSISKINQFWTINQFQVDQSVFQWAAIWCDYSKTHLFHSKLLFETWKTPLSLIERIEIFILKSIILRI